MGYRRGLLAGVFLLGGCGNAMEVATTARPLTETDWFSEEAGGADCPSGTAVRGVACKGHYCDAMQLTCDEFTGTFMTGVRVTPWFSEEAPNSQMCDDDEVVTGIRCSGAFCDDLALRCQQTDQLLTSCRWTGPFSDERGPWVSNRGAFLRGVRCADDYCDNKWYFSCAAPLPPRPEPIPLVADVTCSLGEPDCNVCADDVQSQLASAFHPTASSMSWGVRKWSFGWNDLQFPAGVTPRDAFDDGSIGIASKHVQGFVRTNHPEIPFAGSYSDDTVGTIFLVKPNDFDFDFVLSNLHESNRTHPSGVHTIGQYVALAELDNLRLIDLERASEAHDIHYLIPRDDPRGRGIDGAGGGIGLVRLAEGGHLLLATGPGGDNIARTRWTRFYHVMGDLEAPDEIRYLGEFAYEVFGEDLEDYSRAENLSVISECNTGDIYVIHTYGNREPWLDGYWRLSRVEPGRLGPVLHTVAVYRQGQDFYECFHRASATAFANPNHRLDLYCHGYDATYAGFGAGDLTFRIGFN